MNQIRTHKVFTTFLVLTVLCCVSTWLGFIGFRNWLDQGGRELTEQSTRAQIQLASELGVNLNDFPNPYQFPNNYFRQRLQPKMPIATVHTIIRKYKAVFHCSTNREVYDFLSTDVSIRRRFEIRYDEEKRYIQDSLKGDDPWSDPVIMTDCQRGLLAE